MRWFEWAKLVISLVFILFLGLLSPPRSPQEASGFVWMIAAMFVWVAWDRVVRKDEDDG